MKEAGLERAFALLCVICAVVFFVSAALSAEMKRTETAKAPLVETGGAEEKKEEAEFMYTLLENDGKVYIYSGGRPFAVTDIDPAHLPKEDREKLRQGIGAGDREALLRLLEDFGS